MRLLAFLTLWIINDFNPKFSVKISSMSEVSPYLNDRSTMPFSFLNLLISLIRSRLLFYFFRLYLFAAFLLGGIIGFLLDSYTDSVVPYWDGITTALFFVAMILMAQKKIENWIFWIMGNAICIPLFFSKGLCLSSFQYCIFTILAFAGFISWYRKLQNKIVTK